MMVDPHTLKTRTITVHVDSATVNAYEASSEADRHKFDLLIALRLKELIREPRPLAEVIDEVSHKAQERGLTPELLEAMLAEQ